MSKVYVKKRTNISKDKLKWAIGKHTQISIGELIYTYEPSEHDKKQRWERLKWERLDEEEQANYRDRNIYIPVYIKKKKIIDFLNMKYDAGKKFRNIG